MIDFLLCRRLMARGTKVTDRPPTSNWGGLPEAQAGSLPSREFKQPWQYLQRTDAGQITYIALGQLIPQAPVPGHGYCRSGAGHAAEQTACYPAPQAAWPVKTSENREKGVPFGAMSFTG